MKKEIYARGKNFLLIKERTSEKQNKSCVVRLSGYTTTVKAINTPWILQQLTLLHLDRSLLPDPCIAPQIVPEIFDEIDCDLFNLYFLPECKGLKFAMEEFAEFLENNLFCHYKKHALIGHSKGGLFVAGISNYISTHTNIAMIAPTFGTIMGNPEEVLKKFDDYKKHQTRIKRLLLTPEIALYKAVTHITSSRRPIDYDMYMNSELLNSLDLSKLENHRTLLVIAECPEKPSINDIVFKRYGKFLGLNTEADGMVMLSNQKRALSWVDNCIRIEATHPSALGKAMELQEMAKFLYDM